MRNPEGTSRITVTGRQSDPGAPERSGQEITVTADARCRYVGDRFHIVYTDGGIRTHIIIGDGRMEIRRSGGIRSEMVIEPGQTHPMTYMTAEGSLSFDVAADTLTSHQEGDVFLAKASYRLLSGDTVLSRNETDIQIKGPGGKQHAGTRIL